MSQRAKKILKLAQTSAIKNKLVEYSETASSISTEQDAYCSQRVFEDFNESSPSNVMETTCLSTNNVQIEPPTVPDEINESKMKKHSLVEYDDTPNSIDTFHDPLFENNHVPLSVEVTVESTCPSRNKVYEKTSKLTRLRPTKTPYDTDVEDNISIFDISISSFDSPFSSDDSVADKTYQPSSSNGSSDSESIDQVSVLENTSNYGTDDSLAEHHPEQNEMWRDIIERDTDFEFNGNTSKINVDSTNIKEPIDAYKLFVSDEVLRVIAFETNRYAAQTLSKADNQSKSRSEVWMDTDVEELQDFFAIIIAIGLVPLPEIKLYWSKDDIFMNKFVSSIMPRDRFMLILKFLHFADNNMMDGSNRLHKIQPLINMLSLKFKDVLTPGKEIVIDESMIPFRGRLIFRQYIPNKSHKYGVKIYKLCTLEGYTYSFIIYGGKGTGDANVPHTDSIVHKLLTNLKGEEGRILYADNFYSSLPLVKSLYKQKIMYCGTLRSNKKGIPKFFDKKLKRGEICGKEYENKIRVLKWMDKRAVLMITSHPTHTDNLIETGKRNRKGEIVKKPKAVLDYNIAKKGVDISDQMSSYFTVLRKSRKWYRKVALELIFGTSVVNAWVVYKKVTKSKISMLDFRKSLAKSLAHRKKANENVARKAVHTFVKPEGPGRKPRKKCVGCYQKLRTTLSSVEADKKTRKVISYCNECDGKPGYCLDCFNTVHKN